MTASRVSRIVRTGVLALAASLVVATPAFAHGNGVGHGHGNDGHNNGHGNGGQDHGHGKENNPKPTLDLTTVTVTPADAAAKAITAAGGTGDLLEIRLEAKKKGPSLVVDVQTPTGPVEVKLSITGDVLKTEKGDSEDGDHLQPMAAPPAGVTFATYGAAVPAGGTPFSIVLRHNHKTNTDGVTVGYYDANGKKGKVRLNLDGTPAA